MKVIRDFASPIQAKVIRQVGVPPSTQARADRIAVVSKWATCPTPCTPASVRPAQKIQPDRVRRDLGQRLFQRGLHGANAGLLRLPTPEQVPVILNAQRYPHLC